MSMKTKLGTMRTRFVWWPIRLWVTKKKYVERTGQLRWLCSVTEMWTLKGWTAYEHIQ